MNFDQSSSYSKEDLIDCGNGELFGPKNGRLPVNEMLMFDSICDISKGGGINKMGHVIAELVISPNLWVFDCHFVGDPVMPGCLGLDALWQLTGFNLGWRGLKGRGRALGVGEVKFKGMVTPHTKLVRYDLNFSRVLERRLKLGISDGKVFADGEEIFSAKGLKVGLFED